MRYKLLTLLFISILLTGVVSAWEWDNIVVEGNLNPKTGYPNLEIKNAFGFGETLFEGKLEEHTKICGSDCYSKMEIIHDGGVLIDDIEFRTIQDDGSYIVQPIRSFNFEYETEDGFEEYIVGEEVREGNYELYLRGEKKPTRTVDWVIKIQGKWLDEWAYWGGYDFTDYEYLLTEDNLTITSGTTILGGNKLYNQVFVSEIGIIEVNSTIGYLNITAYNVTIIGNITGTGKSNNTGGTSGGSGGPLGSSTDAGNGGNGDNSGSTGGNGGTGGRFQNGAFNSGGAGGASASVIGTETGLYEETISGLGGGAGGGGGGSSGTSGMQNGNAGSSGTNSRGGATIKINSGLLYITGKLSMNGATGGSGGAGKSASAQDSSSGGGGGGAGGTGGQIILQGVNVNISNSILNTAGGSGGSGGSGGGSATYGDGGSGSGGQVGNSGRIKVFYGVLDNSSMTGTASTTYFNQFSSVGIITLDSPMNDFTTSLNIIEFNGSAIITGGSSTIINMSLFTNQSGIFELVNSSIGLSGTSNESSFNHNIIEGDGNYLWNFQVCDSDGDCGFASENRTLILDNINPQINILSPIGNQGYFISKNNLSVNWTATDPILDSCWFDYNNINTTVTCGANNYSFTTIDGQQSLIFYANDTAGNLGSNTTNWTYSVLENNVSFAEEEFENQITTITGNFTLGISLSNVILVYNGTNYIPSIAEIDGDHIFIANVETPIVSSDQNISFYYLIENSEVIQTQTHNQTIKNVDITTSCPSDFDIINITNYDEETINQISGTVEFTLNLLNSEEEVTETLSGNSTGETVQFCSNVNLSSSSSLYNMQLRYYKDGYAFETYNIENTDATSLPIAVDLYFLNNSISTEFKMPYLDFLYLEHPGAIIQIQRQYLSEDVYRLVEVPLISDNGDATGTFSTDNIQYQIIVIEDGVVLDLFEKIFPKCQNIVLGTCNIDLLGVSGEDMIEGDDFTYTIVKGSNEVTLTFIIPSGEPKTIQLITNQSSRFIDDVSSCIQTTFATGGSLTCSYNETVGDSELDVNIFTNDELELQGRLLISTNVNALFLTNNYFIAFILLGTLATIFIGSGVMMVVSAIVGIFYLGFVFLIRMDSLNITLVASSVMWLIIAGGALIFKLAQKDERT